MTIAQLAALTSMVTQASEVGLTLVQGIRALSGIFGHDLTAEEQASIEMAILVDATRRRDESRRMSSGA